VDEQAVDEQAVDEQAVDEQAVDEQAVDERAVDERAVDERAVDERAVDGERAAAAQGHVAPASAPVGDSTAPVGDYALLLAEARSLGLRKQAELPYLKAIGANPAGAEALSGLSMLYATFGKNVHAKERAEQALALNQNLDEAWIVLGAAESALGKPRAARAAYVRCAGLPSGKYVAECKRLLR